MAFQMQGKIRWVSLPVLAIGFMFSRFATSYGFLLDFGLCLAALLVVLQAVEVRKYFCAGGFVAIAVIFSPLMPAVKTLLLMGFTCIATSATLFAIRKPQPQPLPAD
jgi:uncharacterized membrane protein